MPDFNEFIGGPENARIFRKTGEIIDMRTKASLEAIWNAMPWGMKVELPGGEDATLEKFVAPRFNDGAWEFGFDVRDTTGNWHIEFFVTKTGWGGTSVEKMERKTDDG